MNKTGITIADVAYEAGVSVSTVSKVINERYGVGAETSARVREIIERLGYRSSLVAQSMRSRQTKVIGVLTTDIEPFNAEVLKGVARGVRGSGFDLVIFSDCGKDADLAGWERRYLSRVSTLTDGAILVTPGTVDIATQVPVVAVDHNVASLHASTIDADNFAGAAGGTKHLLELRHRRIAFLGGRADLASARLREQGFREALAAAGITPDETLILDAGYDPQLAVEHTRALLARPEPPTAIFAANDVMAIAVMVVARELGLDVPGDLSVIGFDNVPESVLSDPPLTTIDQSVQEMGYLAVRTLVDLIEDPSREPQQVILPTRLVVRQSSGPARAN
jgi:LacI family transcriptional regulator